MEGEDNSVLFLVFQYLDCDLRKYMRRQFGKGNGMPNALACRFLHQILLGLAHVHAAGIMHRDLKLANILVDTNERTVKIADFGMARATDVPVIRYSKNVTALWYRAPEVLLASCHYSTAVDMWSCGCVFAQMLRGSALFDSVTQLGQLMQIFEALGTPTEETWKGVERLEDWHEFPKWEGKSIADMDGWPEGVGKEEFALLDGMLTLNPAKRMTTEQALKSPYFASLRPGNSAADEVVAAAVRANNSAAGEDVAAPARAENTVAEEVVAAPVRANNTAADEVVPAPVYLNSTNSDGNIAHRVRAKNKKARRRNSAAADVVESPVRSKNAASDQIVAPAARANSTAADEAVASPASVNNAATDDIVAAPVYPNSTDPDGNIGHRVRARNRTARRRSDPSSTRNRRHSGRT